MMLGAGTRLFNEGIPEQRLVLLDSNRFKSGLVLLTDKVEK